MVGPLFGTGEIEPRRHRNKVRVKEQLARNLVPANLPPAVERAVLQQLGALTVIQKMGQPRKSVKLYSLPLPQILAETPMTEEKKHAILFTTTLLCARKIIDLIDTNASERIGKKFWLDEFEKESIDQVVQIMDKIDQRWPTETAVSTANPRSGG